MTLPYALRVNAQFPFPATVKGSGPITIAKANGIWTVSLVSFNQLSATPSTGLATKFVLIYDQVTNTFMQTTLAAILAAGAQAPTIVTAAGDYNVLTTDQTILMNKTVGAATNVNLPTSASRNGVPVIVKDYKGDAATNNITIVPLGAETIDGFSGAAAAVNGVAVVDANNGRKSFYPLTSGGWYLL